jgi:uncharacterized protein (DUF924 family)
MYALPYESLLNNHQIKDRQPEDVLRFWFANLNGDQQTGDQQTAVRQWQWWFSGGGNADITARFSPLLKQAIRGELNDWASEPHSRLALIIVLDQFSRAIYRGTAQAFAQDEKACSLALEGIAIGHYAALKTPWEKTFFFLPLGHYEQDFIQNQSLLTKLADELVVAAPPEHHGLLEFSAAQARRHADVIARFARQPHRNRVLGRKSTLEELDYLNNEQLVHTHAMPPQLSKFLL